MRSTQNSTYQQRIIKSISEIEQSRFPLIIELAGLPKLGKTVFADSLTDLIKRAGYSVNIAPDGTSIFPNVDRWSLEYSAWTISSFVKIFLETKTSNLQFLIADRGLFDALVWLHLKKEKYNYDRNSINAFRKFILSDLWLKHYCSVLVFVGSNDKIIGRSRERRLYIGESKVTTAGNLNALKKAIEIEVKGWNSKKKIVTKFNVDNLSMPDLLSMGTEHIVSSIENNALIDIR